MFCTVTVGSSIHHNHKTLWILNKSQIFIFSSISILHGESVFALADRSVIHTKHLRGDVSKLGEVRDLRCCPVECRGETVDCVCSARTDVRRMTPLQLWGLRRLGLTCGKHSVGSLYTTLLENNMILLFSLRVRSFFPELRIDRTKTSWSSWGGNVKIHIFLNLP